MADDESPSLPPAALQYPPLTSRYEDINFIARDIVANILERAVESNIDAVTEIDSKLGRADSDDEDCLHVIHVMLESIEAMHYDRQAAAAAAEAAVALPTVVMEVIAVLNNGTEHPPSSSAAVKVNTPKTRRTRGGAVGAGKKKRDKEQSLLSTHMSTRLTSSRKKKTSTKLVDMMDTDTAVLTVEEERRQQDAALRRKKTIGKRAAATTTTITTTTTRRTRRTPNKNTIDDDIVVPGTIVRHQEKKKGKGKERGIEDLLNSDFDNGPGVWGTDAEGAPPPVFISKRSAGAKSGWIKRRRGQVDTSGMLETPPATSIRGTRTAVVATGDPCQVEQNVCLDSEGEEGEKGLIIPLDKTEDGWGEEVCRRRKEADILIHDVLYGCPKCKYTRNGCLSCRKKSPAFLRPPIRWKPEEGRPQADIPTAPTFRPTVEEFQDPVVYIENIADEAEKWGLAHIVPPAGWDPPFALINGTNGLSMESFRFEVRKQFTSSVCIRDARISQHSGNTDTTTTNNKKEDGNGSIAPKEQREQKEQGGDPSSVSTAPPIFNFSTFDAGKKYGRLYQTKKEAKGTATIAAAAAAAAADDDDDDIVTNSEDADFGFTILERKHTLQSFAAYADWAKELHFSSPSPSINHRGPDAIDTGPRNRPKALSTTQHISNNDSNTGAAAAIEPTVEEVEAEFWRIVECADPNDVIESLYGQDLDSGHHGSGFPLPEWRRKLLEEHLRQSTDSGIKTLPPYADAKEEQYAEHPWNINNMPRSTSSVLRYLLGDELITGVMVPWLYVGSVLSAFCWHIEDHALYSVNYLHLGAPKVWYGVPAHATQLLEEAMKDAVPHLFAANPNLLYQLVTLVSPTELRKRGVPVCRVVHEPGSFVVTMPNSYHAGFNTGFNVAEAVNFGAPRWLPYGSDVAAKYRESGKPLTLSHDSLLVALAMCAQHNYNHHQYGENKEEKEQGCGDGIINNDASPALVDNFMDYVNGIKARDDNEDAREVIKGTEMDDGQQQIKDIKDAWEAAAAMAVEKMTTGSTTAGMGMGASSSAAASMRTGAAGGAQGAPLGNIPWSKVPLHAITLATGELAVRVDEEKRRHAAGLHDVFGGGKGGGTQGINRNDTTTENGQKCATGCESCATTSTTITTTTTITWPNMQRMDARATAGAVNPITRVHINTADVDCAVCSTDLWLTAVVSPSAPGVAVCPEHALYLCQEKECVKDSLVLLYRHSIAELEKIVCTAVEKVPQAVAAVETAKQRKQEKINISAAGEGRRSAIQSFGPLYTVPISTWLYSHSDDNDDNNIKGSKRAAKRRKITPSSQPKPVAVTVPQSPINGVSHKKKIPPPPPLPLKKAKTVRLHKEDFEDGQESEDDDDSGDDWEAMYFAKGGEGWRAGGGGRRKGEGRGKGRGRGRKKVDEGEKPAEEEPTMKTASIPSLPEVWLLNKAVDNIVPGTDVNNRDNAAVVEKKEEEFAIVPAAVDAVLGSELSRASKSSEKIKEEEDIVMAAIMEQEDGDDVVKELATEKEEQHCPSAMQVGEMMAVEGEDMPRDDNKPVRVLVPAGGDVGNEIPEEEDDDDDDDDVEIMYLHDHLTPSSSELVVAQMINSAIDQVNNQETVDVCQMIDTAIKRVNKYQ